MPLRYVQRNIFLQYKFLTFAREYGTPGHVFTMDEQSRLFYHYENRRHDYGSYSLENHRTIRELNAFMESWLGAAWVEIPQYTVFAQL